MKKYLLIMGIILTTLANAQELEYCESAATPEPTIEVGQVVKTLKQASEGLFKNIAGLKVNHDGEGKLSVFFENGQPKILKLTYTNGQGTVIRQITFDELAQGQQLIYENNEKKGKAIILEKAGGFKSDQKYKFLMSVRTGLNPEKHSSYPVEFDATMAAPKVFSSNKPFSNIVISPGISMFSWDGTFTKVEFKN